jgi:hypothetical protein
MIIFKILGIISLAMQISKLIYPEFRLMDLFLGSQYMFNPEIFTHRIDRANDHIYYFIESVGSFTYPFFFIWLYTLRKKPAIFVFLIFFYEYIEFVQNGYYGRNNIAIYILFIIVYFYEERLVNKKILNIITFSIIFMAIPIFLVLESLRTGNQVSLDITNYLYLFEQFMYEESLYQKYLETFNSFAPSLSFFEMILRVITLPIPIIPNVDFPILAQAFTEQYIGLQYGDIGYYIVLPGAFGEGLMMLGSSWVWVYGVLIGLFVGFVFNLLKNIPQLKYYLLYFIIDYARAFRGGIQTFIESTFNTSLLLIVFGVFMALIKVKNTDSKKYLIHTKKSYQNKY